MLLMDMGNFEIDNACCVDEGLRKLSAGRYDVVISDYDMPQKNGLQFLEELNNQNNEVPFILFTGKGREEIAIKALNLGADAYINKQGNPETVYGELSHYIRSTVARQRAESKTKETQVLLNSIVNSTRDFIWSMSTDDFRLLTFNQAMSEHFLKTQNLRLEAGMSALQLLPSEAILQKWRELSKRVLEQGSFTIEYTTWKEPRVLEMTFNLLKREDEAFAIAVFGKDITERKKAEEIVKKSEARYRELVDALPAPIFEVDSRGKVVFVNSEAFKMLGYSKEDFEKGFSVFTLVPEREWENTKRNISQSLAGIGSGGNEYTFLRKDGTEFPVIVNAAPIVRDDGSIILRGVVTDITVRKKVEKALIDSEANYKNLINGMNDSAWVIDFDGNFVEVNAAAVDVLGYSKEELLSLGVKGIDKRLNLEQIRNLISNVATVRTKVYETIHLTKDGKEIPLEISASLITHNGKQAVLSVARNISERKKTRRS